MVLLLYLDNDTLGAWCYYCKNHCGSPRYIRFEKGYCGISICGVSDELNEMYKEHTHTSNLKTQSWIAADFIMLVVCPVCLIFGTISNCLSIAVCMCKTLRKMTAPFLLIILAVFDCLSLYMGALPRFLRRISGLYLETYSDSSCRIYNYVIGIVMSFPVWILISLTYERYIAITKPFQVKFICTKTNIFKLMLLVLVCLSLLNIPKSIYSKAHYQIMFEDDDIHFSVQKSCQIINYTVAWVDVASRCILPFMILLTFNITIICLRKRILQNRLSLSVSVNIEKEYKNMKFLTILLLTACFSYIIFALPYFCYILVMPVIMNSGENISHPLDTMLRYTDYKKVDKRGENDGNNVAFMYLWYIICISFAYINNSVNFYLYCLGGDFFRYEGFVFRC